jgi:formylglycine-generating enzyme required for sulfatase activity
LYRTSEVGCYPSNHWGVYDMHGNVSEWVEDDWHENYQGAPSDVSAWTGRQHILESAHLGVARRLLQQQFVGLLVGLPHQVPPRHPEFKVRVPGGPNTFLTNEEAISLRVR